MISQTTKCSQNTCIEVDHNFILYKAQQCGGDVGPMNQNQHFRL